jgi:hypothetical protein
LLSTALLALRVGVIKCPSDDFERSVRAEGGREGTNIAGSHMDPQMVVTYRVKSSCLAAGIMAVFKVGAPVAVGVAVCRLTLSSIIFKY